jgi:radical SAM superfamily enzyme YgiQ (UPF0313 family)
MSRSLYLINPKSEAPTYFGAEVFEGQGLVAAQANADLATVTVAALAPRDWQISVCDEHVEPIDFDHPADFIGLTGKVTQEHRMLEIAQEFRRRGKTVLIGGPYASLSPDFVRGHCDVLVIGELEAIAEEFFADLESGNWKAEYVAEKPELDTSPTPRWDLYNNDRALLGSVQTSRGCPFECEFCDVIQYLGRKQRHKPLDHVIAELDVLYDLGYRNVFLADDNFTVYRKRAKELLAALGEWNRKRPDGPMAFGTQLSIDATRDPEVMQLVAESGMTWVFIGIETPNVESLKETKKRQNVGVDLVRDVEVFLEHGVAVIGGMIVGFDNDGLDIFERQYDFAMRTPIPIFTLGALVAPHATPLYDRMEKDERLHATEEYAGAPWETNIIPSQMTREEMLEGLRWLCNTLYSIDNFEKRTLRMIEVMGPQRGPFEAGYARQKDPRQVEREAIALLNKFVRQGKRERRMAANVFEAMAEKPGSEPAVMLALFRYAQVRHLYEKGNFWEPRLSDGLPFAPSPGAVPAQGGLVTIGS